VQIGSQLFDYGSLALPADFGVGRVIRMTVATTPSDQGHWVVTSIADGVSAPPDRHAGTLRGAIGRVIDERHAFVGGVLVDASAATFAPRGRFLAAGGLVEVRGRMTGTGAGRLARGLSRRRRAEPGHRQRRRREPLRVRLRDRRLHPHAGRHRCPHVPHARADDDRLFDREVHHRRGPPTWRGGAGSTSGARSRTTGPGWSRPRSSSGTEGPP
jgi:hypothetical protein